MRYGVLVFGVLFAAVIGTGGARTARQGSAIYRGQFHDVVPQAVTMSLAIPLYVSPGNQHRTWSEINAARSAVGLVVANPWSGPGHSTHNSYTEAFAASHAAGQRILGYVDTAYAKRPHTAVVRDIDRWYKFYPEIDGIFLDEASTVASTARSYYRPLYEHIKEEPGAHKVVLNPGTDTAEAFMDVADIIVTFEDTYDNYVHATNATWTERYPADRFWNLILSTPADELQNAISLAAERNVGRVFVTDQAPDKAYENLPTGPYWEEELSSVNGR